MLPETVGVRQLTPAEKEFQIGKPKKVTTSQNIGGAVKTRKRQTLLKTVFRGGFTS